MFTKSQQVFIFFLLAIELSLLSLYSAPSSPSYVYVSGYKLMIQKRKSDNTLDVAEPFIMQSVGWSPASKGSGGGQFASWYTTDLPLMTDMGANCLRTWGTFPLNATGTAILDECYNKGIMVIMTVSQSDPSPAVNYFKNHPAILMWLLGNEWNYNKFYGAYSSISECITAINNATSTIHSLDSNHPVATCHGELPSSSTLSSCSGPDVWGLNIYRGISFGSLFSDWKSRSSKPMFISEYGADAYNHNSGSEDQSAQEYALGKLWNEIYANLSANDVNNVAIGGSIFEWNDEWWKYTDASTHDSGGFSISVYPDNVADEEWWGIVDIDRNKRLAYSTMSNLWPKTTGAHAIISFSKNSPMSTGIVNVTITIANATSASSPVLKIHYPDDSLSSLSLSGSGFSYTSSFTVLNSWQNGNYELIFSFIADSTNATTNSTSFIVDTIKPSSPTNLTAYFDDTKIVLQWDTSTDDTSIKQYNVYRGTSTNSFVYIDSTTETIYEDSSVKQETLYYYKLVAVDSAGNESEFSSTSSIEIRKSHLTVFPVPIDFYQDKNLCISLNVSKEEKFSVAIYDVEGKKIADILQSATYNSGTVSATWNGKDVSNHIVKPGLYYCIAKYPSKKEIKKILVVDYE